MSQILERLIEQEVRPRATAYSREKKALAVKNLAPLIASAGGTSKPPSGLGSEFDELLYDILIPSVAEAVQRYLISNVTVIPGQAVVTNPGQPVQVSPSGTGATGGPGTGTVSTPGKLSAP